MSNASSSSLGLRAGEWVVVRSKEEILATLDQEGKFDNLLFQPEMFAYCGKRLRVFMTAHKTCDTVTKTGGRRMDNTVHLEGVRCTGADHGQCQADCLLFWKETWLQRAADVQPGGGQIRTASAGAQATEETVRNATRVGETTTGPEVRWRCQATTLVEATAPLHWWDVRQYLRDVTSGNHSAGHILGVLFAQGYRRLISWGHGYRALVFIYNSVQELRGRPPYASIVGRIPQGQATPVETLDLRPGDWVQVKPLAEIERTIHLGTNHNRGMLFDVEMQPYCGERHQVRARIDRIIDERTGKMIPMKTPCVTLEGVYCKAVCSAKRLGCPRAIPSYWREIWLRRA